MGFKMKYLILVLTVFFSGCSAVSTSLQVANTAICASHNTAHAIVNTGIAVATVTYPTLSGELAVGKAVDDVVSNAIVESCLK